MDYQTYNPLIATVEEAESLLAQLHGAAERLAAAIEGERTVFARMKDAEASYESAEAEALADAVVLATAKEGPLGGVAATSKAYDILLTKLKNDLRSGNLAHLWRDVDRMRRAYDQAQTELRQAETLFTGLRKAAELKAAILKAASI